MRQIIARLGAPVVARETVDLTARMISAMDRIRENPLPAVTWRSMTADERRLYESILPARGEYLPSPEA